MIEQRIISVMERVFKLTGLTADCSQQNCEKWDSLHHLNLIVELEKSSICNSNRKKLPI